MNTSDPNVRQLGEGYFTDTDQTLEEAKLQFKQILPAFHNKPADAPVRKEPPCHS
jgi:hypothetical protein